MTATSPSETPSIDVRRADTRYRTRLLLSPLAGLTTLDTYATALIAAVVLVARRDA